MGAQTTDNLIRALAAEFRVLSLGGIAIIATGLSRNTYGTDIWLDPLGSAEDWARKLWPLISGCGDARPVAMGSWRTIAPGELAAVIERDHVLRIAGLDRPLDIFREPNQLAVDGFDEVWERAQPMDDGTRLPDPIDLLVSKQETGRDKDRADIIFLEGKIEADYLARLPAASVPEAEAMLARFLTPRIAEQAMDHTHPAVQDLGRGFLNELAAEGDPFAAEILRRRSDS
jgi:hypothetical protein